MEGVEGTVGDALCSWSAPVERRYRGTQGPLNGLSCARGPRRRHSGTDGDPFSEVCLYRTEPTSHGGTSTTSSCTMPRICGLEEVRGHVFQPGGRNDRQNILSVDVTLWIFQVSFKIYGHQ